MKQTYQNHRKVVPVYHYLLYLLIYTVIISSFVKLYQYRGSGEHFYDSLLFLTTGVALFFVAWYTRIFPLKAQDRAIRAEENLRHFVLTGKLLDQRLNVEQIVALRFASDEEFPDLAKIAVEKNLSNKDIKKAIVNWKADNYRL